MVLSGFGLMPLGIFSGLLATPKEAAESRIRWKLLPLIPNEFTLILSARPRGQAVGTVGTASLPLSHGTVRGLSSQLGVMFSSQAGPPGRCFWTSSYSLAGFGLLNLMLGMIVLFSSDKVALMMLLRAEFPSLCPRLGLI